MTGVVNFSMIEVVKFSVDEHSAVMNLGNGAVVNVGKKMSQFANFVAVSAPIE